VKRLALRRSRVLGRLSCRPLLAFALLLAYPGGAYAYVDPGAGIMLWQVAALGLIGGLFYAKRVTEWVRDAFALRSARAAGFAFASCFAVVASPVTVALFQGHPLPRFNDVFLIGIVLTAYLFAWQPAAYLLVIAVFVSAWVLPPYGSMRVEGAAEWYRLASFTALGLFLIFLISRMKARSRASNAGGSPISMQEAAAGMD